MHDLRVFDEFGGMMKRWTKDTASNQHWQDVMRARWSSKFEIWKIFMKDWWAQTTFLCRVCHILACPFSDWLGVRKPESEDSEAMPDLFSISGTFERLTSSEFSRICPSTRLWSCCFLNSRDSVHCLQQCPSCTPCRVRKAQQLELILFFTGFWRHHPSP